jgi:hypothetical protein
LLGFFAMSVTGYRFASKNQKSKICCAIAIFTCALFSTALGDAGSVSAQFSVSVRVEKSCRVSASSLASQATSTNQTANVNCGAASASVTSTDSAAAGSSLSTSSAIVNYSVSEVSGTDGDSKVLSINF